MSTMVGRILLGSAVGSVLLYLTIPVVVVVAISFSSGNYLAFPPPGLSWRWYQTIINDPEWVNAFWVTIKVGRSRQSSRPPWACRPRLRWCVT